MNIVFIHSNIGQFKLIHQHLGHLKGHQSYVICSENACNKHKDNIKNLLPFKPHGGKLHSKDGFFYLKKLEEVNRRSIGILNAVNKLIQQQPIDLIVAHSTAGAPMMLFDELDIPIISYIEFPSFRQHGWDKAYPPPKEKRRRDKNFEMLSYFNTLKSQLVITPSLYAKRMFPKELQNKVVVQMEGFDLVSNQHKISSSYFEPAKGKKYIGFAARDLSSAKGFEQFIKITQKIAALRDDVQFVVIGSYKLLYSYEQHFLLEKYGQNSKVNFVDYVLEKTGIDRKKYIFTGMLGYAEYDATIKAVNMFLYPVQFSSASWGLMELMGREKIVVASDRCYVPEIMRDGNNGFILDYDDIPAWVDKSIEIIDNLPNYNFIAQNARKRIEDNYNIRFVSQAYLQIFDRIITDFRDRN